MHRDIKPSNIIFKNNSDFGTLILIDFGFAQNVEENKYIYEVCGTLKYMAPEIMMYNSNFCALYD